jgi:hypothetical protein
MSREHLDYGHRVPSTEEERRLIAAAKLAHIDAQAEFFAAFGVNAADAASMEEFKDVIRFARSLKKRPELWQELDFLHSLRSGSIKAWSRFYLAIVTLAAAGVVWSAIAAFKAWIATFAGTPH